MREVTLLAREYTAEAIETLIEIMEDDDAPKAARARAAEILLDRGWGKAPQTINVRSNPLEEMSEDEQHSLLRALEALAGIAPSNDGGSPAQTH